MKGLNILFLTLVLLTATEVWGQDDCTPQMLPWFEEFESDFVWNNGWINTTLDTTFFEYDHCWIHGFKHFCGWKSMISFEYFSVENPPPIRNNVLDIEKCYWSFYGTEPGLKYAVTPRFSESPSLVTFKAYSPLAQVHPSVIEGEYRDTVFPDGFMVSIGYISEESDPLDSYVPLDTVYVTSRDRYNKSFCCSDLGNHNIPPPYRLAFRVAEPMVDWRGTILCYIDSISVTNGALPTDTTYLYDTICQGYPYSGHGFFLPGDSATTPYLLSRDSVVDCQRYLFLLRLAVRPSSSTDCYASLRQNDTLRFADSTITSPGSYHFLYTAANGCDSTVTLHVSDCTPSLCVESNHPFLDYDYPVLVLQNCSEGCLSSEWTFDDDYRFSGDRIRRQFHHPLPDTSHVTLTTCNSDGCCADTTLCFPLKIRSVWFPNTFAPDGEESNRFGLHTSCDVTSFSLDIYNRRGQRVWFTTSPSATWDGTHDGFPLPQGAYVYRWSLTDSRGDYKFGTGTITLLR